MNSAVLKSKISTSVQVFKLPDHAALLFTWCLAHTDDYGRVPACADWWALRIAPGRTDPARATEAIEQIVGAGLLTRYCCGGSDYLFVPNWFRHQGFNDTYTLKALYPHPTTGVVEAPIKWPDFRRAYPTEESRMYYNGSTTVVQREYRTEDNTPSPSPSPSPSPTHSPPPAAIAASDANELSERDMGGCAEVQGEPSMFSEFMSHYPKDSDRVQALIEWRRVCRNPQEAAKAITGLKRQIAAGQFECEFRFIPLASSYLRKRRFEDDVKPRAVTVSSKPSNPFAAVDAIRAMEVEK